MQLKIQKAAQNTIELEAKSIAGLVDFIDDNFIKAVSNTK